MMNIAKDDMLLKRKPISQFEKSDEELKASISKIGKPMESIGNAMQQGVGIKGVLMMQHSPNQCFMNNQNIQSNANNIKRPNYNAGYDTVQRNLTKSLLIKKSWVYVTKKFFSMNLLFI